MRRRALHLVEVGKSFPSPGLLPRVILRPGTISLPTDRRIALLGARGSGKTTILRLLSGQLRPDEGEVIGADQLSPIINAGSLFHPRLTGLDNLRFVSQAYGLDVDMLLFAIQSIRPIDVALDQPWRTQEKVLRRNFEAAAIVALGHACYLLDDTQLLDPTLLDACRDVIESRGSGLVFTTSQSRLAARYAEAIVLIDDARLVFYEDVGEALACVRRTLSHDE